MGCKNLAAIYYSHLVRSRLVEFVPRIRVLPGLHSYIGLDIIHGWREPEITIESDSRDIGQQTIAF